MRKTSVVAGSVALAAAGSAIFSGAALASYGNNDFAGDGVGGEATNNCLNIGIPILSGLGIAGQGEATGASCDASANGTGGSTY